MSNAKVLAVEVFSPGDMTQYHMMLTELGNTLVLSVLNMRICFHFNKGSVLDEGYVCGKLKGVNPCTVKAMLCWLDKQETGVETFWENDRGPRYGNNRHPEMNEYAESVL